MYNARQSIDLCMLTMVLGREAGNQKDDAILAVACSIRNRVLRPGFWNWGRDWAGVIENKFSYSSISGLPGDPNLTKYPDLFAEPWERCLNIAEIVYAGQIEVDPVRGATHYFDKSLDSNPPFWAKNGKMIHTTDVGDFHFYKPAS